MKKIQNDKGKEEEEEEEEEWALDDDGQSRKKWREKTRHTIYAFYCQSHGRSVVSANDNAINFLDGKII